MFLSARSSVVLLRHCGTVLPRARAGTNAAMALISVRRDRPGGVDRTRDGWCKSSTEHCVAACTRCCNRRKVTRSSARTVFARPATFGRTVEARLAPRASGVTSAGASKLAPSTRGGTRSRRISQTRVAQRLRALYEQDNVEPLEILLGSTSLDEAMTNLDNLDRATGQGEDILHELAGARREIARCSHGLAARTAALASATRAAEATAASLSATRAQRSSYISSLSAQRQMTGAPDRKSRRGGKRSPASQRAIPAAAARRYRTVNGSRVLTVSATGYALQGNTASGLPVGWGVVAVDPSVIPLGTHMTIPGYGDAVAADRAGRSSAQRSTSGSRRSHRRTHGVVAP